MGPACWVKLYDYFLPFSLAITNSYSNLNFQSKIPAVMIYLTVFDITKFCVLTTPLSYPGNLFGSFQQIQLRTEDRQKVDLEAVAPYSEVLETAVIWYKKFPFHIIKFS